MAGAAAERKHVADFPAREIAIAQPVDPHHLAAAGHEVVVIGVNGRHASPGTPLELTDEGVAGSLVPLIRNYLGRRRTTTRPSQQCVERSSRPEDRSAAPAEEMAGS